ncbi:glycosyltransferase family 2 protein [Mucilaginibacter segetis]|uniref:Glycosyltransferase family 2 protein n=1 Tax=Mucilaginibacter segetis TaxID=2793071 RepID=A0A934PXT8_9SPHI|nr:glycosyltransferase family 2 protein [Mucilaginibacter segetis]MBK0381056.1 glycosyltransferase family 2 protein [Mucilaginibacter segetis]
MKLSVIVTNYNTCTLLKQALITLENACNTINYELIVVDDASTDGSVQMIQDEFPEANLICNDKHLGISKSHNIAIESAKGEYILLVGADTITSKNTISKILPFMDEHEDAGALGVRILTSRGRFLRYSKVGFNRAWASFLKLTGLEKYFPKSRLYKSNYANRIGEFETAEVDAINGSFMLLRKSVLNEVGALDERFTMYGYDIDLSFRIRLAGYKNYYFPKTYIIKLNRQLLPKFSLSYIRHFYGAMIIFAAKYLFHIPEIKIPGMPKIFAPTYEVER